jgi:hypothetical protein
VSGTDPALAEGEELASNILQKYYVPQTDAKLTSENRLRSGYTHRSPQAVCFSAGIGDAVIALVEGLQMAATIGRAEA